MSRAIEHRIGLKDQFTSGLAKINNSTLKYKSSLKDLEKTSNKTWSAIKSGIGMIGVAVAGLGLASIGQNVIQLASDAEEMQAKFNVVFNNLSQDAENWATSYRKAVGGSRNTIKLMLADSQDMLTGFGATTEQGFELSKQIVTLGTDLASFVNLQGGAGEGIERVRKGLLGETENLKMLGIVINENILANKLASEGDKRKFKDLTELEKIQLRYRIALDQSKNALGNAEREADGYASQLLNLKGILADSGADIGAKLLPVINEVLPKLANGVQKATDLSLGLYDTIKNNWSNISPIVYGIVGGLTAYKTAIIAANVATVTKTASLKLLAWWTTFYGNAATATGGKVGLLTLAQRGLNAAMKANPIGFIIGLLATLVTAGIYVIKNWQQVKLIGMNVWNTIVDSAEWAVNKYIDVSNTIHRALKFVFDWIKYAGMSVWDAVVSSAENSINNLLKPINAIRRALGDEEITVNFGAAKFNAEKPKWDTNYSVIPNVNFEKAKFTDEDIMLQVNKVQAEKDKKKQEEVLKQDELINALNTNTQAHAENTEATKANTKATLKDRTGVAIADSFYSRIESAVWGMA